MVFIKDYNTLNMEGNVPAGKDCECIENFSGIPLEISLCMRAPRLRAFPGHGGAGSFCGIHLIRRGGVPSGAGAFIIH